MSLVIQMKISFSTAYTYVHTSLPPAAPVDLGRKIARLSGWYKNTRPANIIGQDQVIWVRSSRAALLSVRLKLAHVIIEQSFLILLASCIYVRRKMVRFHRRGGFSSYCRMKLKNEIDSALRLSRRPIYIYIYIHELLLNIYFSIEMRCERQGELFHKNRQ